VSDITPGVVVPARVPAFELAFRPRSEAVAAVRAAVE